jgi:hypothetical protein
MPTNTSPPDAFAKAEIVSESFEGYNSGLRG